MDKAEQQAAVYANRRRIAGGRGIALLRRRGERVERPFAPLFETGRLRRLHVRGRENVQKKLLLQAVACNLALLLPPNPAKRRAGPTPPGIVALSPFKASAPKLHQSKPAPKSEPLGAYPAGPR